MTTSKSANPSASLKLRARWTVPKWHIMEYKLFCPFKVVKNRNYTSRVSSEKNKLSQSKKQNFTVTKINTGRFWGFKPNPLPEIFFQYEYNLDYRYNIVQFYKLRTPLGIFCEYVPDYNVIHKEHIHFISFFIIILSASKQKKNIYINRSK